MGGGKAVEDHVKEVMKGYRQKFVGLALSLSALFLLLHECFTTCFPSCTSIVSENLVESCWKAHDTAISPTHHSRSWLC